MESWARTWASWVKKLNPRTLFSSFIEPEAFRGEVIFIADRSGSMQGPKIDALKEVLQVFLRSIPSEYANFNIYSFGSTHSALWPVSRQYTQRNLDEASAHISTFTADMGGTEILEPIRDVVNRRIDTPDTST
jgi:uncharacterized protein with von Willebrand factor type A (vWA) domain